MQADKTRLKWLKIRMFEWFVYLAPGKIASKRIGLANCSSLGYAPFFFIFYFTQFCFVLHIALIRFSQQKSQLAGIAVSYGLLCLRFG